MNVRVLFVINTGEFGGLERHLLELAFRLDAIGAECTILSYGPDFYTQRLGTHHRIQVVSTQPGDRESLGGYLSRFRALRPGAIIFEKGNLNAFPLAAFVAAKLSGAKTIVIEQLLPEPLPPPVAIRKPRDIVRFLAGYRTRVKWTNRLMASFVNRTICVSTSIRNRLVDEYGFLGARHDHGIQRRSAQCVPGPSSRRARPGWEPVAGCRASGPVDRLRFPSGAPKEDRRCARGLRSHLRTTPVLPALGRGNRSGRGTVAGPVWRA